MFNIFNALLQAGHPVDEHRELRIEWNLPVDIGLPMHEAAKRTLVELLNRVLFLLLLQGVGLGLLLAQDQLLLAVLKVKDELANDAVLPLAVRSAVEEDCSAQMSLLVLPRVRTRLVVVLLDCVDQVLDGQVSIADYELPVILVQRNRDVEQLLPPCMLRVEYLMLLIIAARCLCSSSRLAKLQDLLDAVILAYDICVHRIHRHSVIVDALRLQGLLMELQVVALEDLVLVERERVLHSHVLDVLVGQQVLGLAHVLVEVLILEAFALVLHLANEFVQDRYVLEFLDLYFEDVLDLAVGLAWVLGIREVITMPIAFFLR